MSIVVRAFPILGSRSELNAFVDELNGSRREDAARFYREFGITHESWHLQETPNGPWVIVVTMIRDAAEAAQRYAAATAEFHAWFKGQVMAITGVDPNSAPLGPPTSPVFHWSDPDHPKEAIPG